MKLFSRIAAVVALLVVPLALAVASQALATRPGPPSVPGAPVLLRGVPSAGGGAQQTPAPRPTVAPRTTPPVGVAPSPRRQPAAPAPRRAAEPAAPGQAAEPRVVRPAPVPLGDDADDADDASDGEDGDG